MGDVKFVSTKKETHIYKLTLLLLLSLSLSLIVINLTFDKSNFIGTALGIKFYINRTLPKKKTLTRLWKQTFVCVLCTETKRNGAHRSRVGGGWAVTTRENRSPPSDRRTLQLQAGKLNERERREGARRDLDIFMHTTRTETGRVKTGLYMDDAEREIFEASLVPG